MEESPYAVEISQYNGKVYLYEKRDDTFISIGEVPSDYSIDRVLLAVISEKVTKFPPFLVSQGGKMYIVPKDLGEVVKLHSKVFSMLPSFYEKLLYVERLQFFTLMGEENYKELIRRLEVYYMTKKVEQSQEES